MGIDSKRADSVILTIHHDPKGSIKSVKISCHSYLFFRSEYFIPALVSIQQLPCRS